MIYLKAKEFDKKFDENKNFKKHLDLAKLKRSKQDQKRVSVDFQVRMIDLLDKEARRLSRTKTVDY